MREDNVLLKRYPVHYYDLDMFGRLQPVAILNYLQDAAAEHASLLGVSVPLLMERGLTWVLSRMHLSLDRPIMGEETLAVKTWPASREGLFTCREFEVYDGGGQIVARATSSWAVIDLETRRPVQLDARIPTYPLHPQRAIACEFPTLTRLKNAGKETTYSVRRSDLDINRHVNNAVYAGWALDTIPDEVASQCILANLEVGYKAEAFAGETIVSRVAISQTDPFCLIHQLVNFEDGRELARLRTRWRPQEK